MKKLVWLLLLSVVLSACGNSTSSVSNTASGVSVAKSVFNRTESSALQGTASQVIKSSVSGSAIAIYNPANGQVTIPQLQVSGDTSGTTYSVEMMFQGDFLVVTSLVVVGTSTATSATALYYPFTGTVSMPYLTVTGDTSGTQYTVSLQQQGNSMNFSVANVALAPVFSSIEGTYTGTMTITSTACTTNYTVGQTDSRPMIVTKQSDNTYALTLVGNGGWGVDGNTTPLYATLSGNRLVGTFTQPPLGAGYSCPTCTWTNSFDATLDASGNLLSGTIVKTGSGGECSYSGTITGTKQSNSTTIGVFASYDSAYANCVYFPNNGQYWIQAYIVDPSKSVQSASLTGYKIATPIPYTYNLYPNLPGRWASAQNVLVSTGTPPTFPLNYTVTVKNMDGTTQSVNLVVTSSQVAQ